MQNAALIPDAHAAAAAKAILYTGTLTAVWGYIPWITLEQLAGMTRTVSGPAALSTYRKESDELQPAHADEPFSTNSSLGISVMVSSSSNLVWVWTMIAGLSELSSLRMKKVS